MSRYRFALGPKWIISHVFVLGMVVAMVNLGFWQIHRLQDKRERNAQVTERKQQPVADASSLAKPGKFQAAEDLEFRRATATGTYQADQEVLVRSRSYDGSPGSWVLTPLRIDDLTSVLVNRGWIPNSGQFTAVPERFKAPSGTITAVGLVRTTEMRGSFGSTDPATGTLTDLARADIARVDQQVPEDLLPFTIQLQEQTPPAGRFPRLVPAPALDEGPHLSYAIQWFTFSLMTIVVYVLILRRRAREVEREAKDAAFDQAADPSPDPG